jgi:hypothetical protein
VVGALPFRSATHSSPIEENSDRANLTGGRCTDGRSCSVNAKPVISAVLSDIKKPEKFAY